MSRPSSASSSMTAWRPTNASTDPVTWAVVRVPAPASVPTDATVDVAVAVRVVLIACPVLAGFGLVVSRVRSCAVTCVPSPMYARTLPEICETISPALIPRTDPPAPATPFAFAVWVPPARMTTAPSTVTDVGNGATTADRSGPTRASTGTFTVASARPPEPDPTYPTPTATRRTSTEVTSTALTVRLLPVTVVANSTTARVAPSTLPVATTRPPAATPMAPAETSTWIDRFDVAEILMSPANTAAPRPIPARTRAADASLPTVIHVIPAAPPNAPTP